MQITQVYNYQPLQRIDSPEGRRYVAGGEKLPSVTTILSATKDTTHLDEWRNNVGHEKAAKISKEATDLGNGMHKNLENYIFGKPMEGTFMEKALANLIVKKAFPKITQIWGSEVGLYSAGLYAGTTDLVGTHEGIPAIMDFKNSLSPKKKEWIEDYFMQLAAYAIAHNELYGTTINRGVIMMATRDAQYLEFVIEGEEFTHYETMWANKLCAYYDLVQNG